MAKAAAKTEESIETAVPQKGVQVKRILMHQAFTIGGVTENSLYESKGFKMILTPEGILGEYKGHKFIVPAANVIVAYL